MKPTMYEREMIHNAYCHLENPLPLNKETYTHFPRECIGFIGQFLFCFAKPQGSMGEKLFSVMLFLLGEDFSKKPFIDILNRLEKLELIDRQEWIDLRAIRNYVANEYSYNVAELVESLNDIFRAKSKLLAVYETSYEYCRHRFDFVRNSPILCRENNT